VSLDTLQFDLGASAFTITNNTAGVTFDLYGGGALNDSLATQTLVTGPGRMAFHNSAEADGMDFVINATGRLTFFDSSVLDDSNILVNVGGRLKIQDDADVEDSYILNYGQTEIEDDVVFDDTVVDNYGTFSFEDGQPSAGTAKIVTYDGGTLEFTFNGQGGMAEIITNGTGKMDMSEDLNGSVTVGSIAGSGTYHLGGLNLTVGSRNIDSTVSGILMDGGTGGGTGASLTKIGPGTLTLTGANTYTGDTTVLGGTLAAGNVSALGTGNVIVNGGTLSGYGSTAVSIAGYYTQNSISTLQLGFSGVSAGEWDILNVAGPATLAGTLKLSPYNNFHVHGDQTFLLLTSTGGVNGTFDTMTDLINANTLTLTYGANDVTLEAIGPTFQAVGVSANQKGIGAVIDTVQGAASDPALVGYLSSLDDADLRAAYDQISPATLAPMFRMEFASAQIQSAAIADRLSQRFGDSHSNSYASSYGNSPLFAGDIPAAQEAQMAKGAETGRWGVFVDGMGNYGTVTADSNGPGYQFSTGGTTAGVDCRFDKNFAGGLLFGYDQSGTSQSTGSVNVAGGQFGLYAGLKQDEIRVSALVDAGLDNYTTKRTSVGGDALGSTQGLEYTAQMNVGYDLKAANVTFSPFVSGQFTQVDISGFTETGSLSPLVYGNQGETYLSSHLGIEASLNGKIGDGQLMPTFSASWEHVYQGAADNLAASLGTNTFTVASSATGTDAALLGAGVRAELDKNFNAHVEYQGKVGMANYTSQGFSGGVNFGF
jgi:autotransporter-associated beta strand protein